MLQQAVTNDLYLYDQSTEHLHSIIVIYQYADSGKVLPKDPVAIYSDTAGPASTLL